MSSNYLEFWANNGKTFQVYTKPTISSTGYSAYVLLNETDDGLQGLWESATPTVTPQTYPLGSGGFMPNYSMLRLPPKTVTFKIWAGQWNNSLNTQQSNRNDIRELSNLLAIGIHTVNVADYGLLLDGWLADAPIIEYTNEGRDVTITFTLTFNVPIMLPQNTFTSPATASIQPATITASSSTFNTSDASLRNHWYALGGQVTSTVSSATTKTITIQTFQNHTNTDIRSMMFSAPFTSRQTRNFIVLGGHAYFAGTPANMWTRVPLQVLSGVSSYFPPITTGVTTILSTEGANVRPRLFTGWV